MKYYKSEVVEKNHREYSPGEEAEATYTREINGLKYLERKEKSLIYVFLYRWPILILSVNIGPLIYIVSLKMSIFITPTENCPVCFYTNVAHTRAYECLESSLMTSIHKKTFYMYLCHDL